MGERHIVRELFVLCISSALPWCGSRQFCPTGLCTSLAELAQAAATAGEAQKNAGLAEYGYFGVLLSDFSSSQTNRSHISICP